MTRKTLIPIWMIILFMAGGCVTAESLKTLSESQLRYSQGSYGTNLYRQEMVRRHPEWPEETRQSILNRKVSIGMTSAQARASWGEPRDINRTGTTFGISEQWVYGDPLYGARYLYFNNGILTSWQN